MPRQTRLQIKIVACTDGRTDGWMDRQNSQSHYGEQRLSAGASFRLAAFIMLALECASSTRQNYTAWSRARLMLPFTSRSRLLRSAPRCVLSKIRISLLQGIIKSGL